MPSPISAAARAFDRRCGRDAPARARGCATRAQTAHAATTALPDRRPENFLARADGCLLKETTQRWGQLARGSIRGEGAARRGPARRRSGAAASPGGGRGAGGGGGGGGGRRDAVLSRCLRSMPMSRYLVIESHDPFETHASAEFF